MYCETFVPSNNMDCGKATSQTDYNNLSMSDLSFHKDLTTTSLLAISSSIPPTCDNNSTFHDISIKSYLENFDFTPFDDVIPSTSHELLMNSPPISHESMPPTNEACSLNGSVCSPLSTSTDKKRVSCTICEKSFTRKDNLKQHIARHYQQITYPCDICNKKLKSKYSLKRHKLMHESRIKQSITQKKSLSNFHQPIKCTDKKSYIHDTYQKTLQRRLDLKQLVPNNEEIKQVITCKQTSSQKHNLDQPLKSLKNSVLLCEKCNQKFNRKSNLTLHLRRKHESACKGEQFKNPYNKLVKHFQRQNALNIFTITTFNSKDDNNNKDLILFLNNFKLNIEKELKFQLYEKTKFKWYISLKTIAYRLTPEKDFEIGMTYFQSFNDLISTESIISRCIEQAFSEIIDYYNQFTQKELEWTIEKIVKLDVCTTKCM